MHRCSTSQLTAVLYGTLPSHTLRLLAARRGVIMRSQMMEKKTPGGVQLGILRSNQPPETASGVRLVRLGRLATMREKTRDLRERKAKVRVTQIFRGRGGRGAIAVETRGRNRRVTTAYWKVRDARCFGIATRSTEVEAAGGVGTGAGIGVAGREEKSEVL